MASRPYNRRSGGMGKAWEQVRNENRKKCDDDLYLKYFLLFVFLFLKFEGKERHCEKISCF